MVDHLTPKARSSLMARIHGRHTQPELSVRKLLFARGKRYRLHSKLPGSPDIVLPRYHAALFVHGCFWHGHDCRPALRPASRPDYWANRIARNRERNTRVFASLRQLGWRVLVVWECAVRNHQKLDAEQLADRLVAWLESSRLKLEIRGANRLARGRNDNGKRRER